jgi:hypothetical protein
VVLLQFFIRFVIPLKLCDQIFDEFDWCDELFFVSDFGFWEGAGNGDGDN